MTYSLEISFRHIWCYSGTDSNFLHFAACWRKEWKKKKKLGMPEKISQEQIALKELQFEWRQKQRKKTMREKKFFFLWFFRIIWITFSFLPPVSSEFHQQILSYLHTFIGFVVQIFFAFFFSTVAKDWFQRMAI